MAEVGYTVLGAFVLSFALGELGAMLRRGALVVVAFPFVLLFAVGSALTRGRY
jgi:hypothetical protein